MQCLNEEVEGHDLLEFSRIWLKNSGCNKIDSEFVFSDQGFVEKILISQSEYHGDISIYRP